MNESALVFAWWRRVLLWGGGSERARGRLRVLVVEKENKAATDRGHTRRFRSEPPLKQNKSMLSIALLASTGAPAALDYASLFSQWKAQHGKSYASATTESKAFSVIKPRHKPAT
jgi:hypothetical protein